MKRTAQVGFGLVLSLGLLALMASAQDKTPSNSPAQSDSALGDYARQVRKDGGTAKAKPKVFDNDNLPREDKLSIVGPTKTASETSAASADANAVSTATGKTAEQENAERQAANKQWEQKLTGQRDQIALLERELDVLQREYQIRAAAMYADAGNRIRNSADWDKKDADYKQQIADKQKAIDDAKQKLDDMQEEARKAGVPAAMREPQ